MRRWLFILVITILLVTQSRSLQSLWARNLAVLQLWPHWSQQQAHGLNPPCQKTGDFLQLEQGFHSRLAVQPADRSATTHLGRVLWLDGNCLEAIALWEKSSQQGDVSASHELFRVGALDVLRAETRLHFSNKASTAAEKLKNAGKEALALEWCQRAFELHPSHETARCVVDRYQKEGDTAAIEQLWAGMAGALPRENPDRWWALAEHLALQDRWVAAARAFLTGAELTGSPFDYWMRAGDAWEKVGKWEQAEDAYRMAYDARPENIWAVLGAARSLRNQQKVREAWDWYQAALEISPDRYEPYYFLGEFAYAHQDYPKAQAFFNEVLSIRPDHAWSQYYLAQIRHQHGETETAEVWLAKAIANYRPDPPVAWWVLMGDWRLEQADCAGAAEAYQAARAGGANASSIQTRMSWLRQTCVEEDSR